MVPMNWKQQIGLNVCKEVNFDALTSIEDVWGRIKEASLNQYLQLFPSFVLFFTKMIVSHGSFISTFDLLTNQWDKKHITFESNVVRIWRDSENHLDDDYNCGVLLSNGTIRFLSQKLKPSREVDEEGNPVMVMNEKVYLKETEFKIPGTIVQSCIDPIDTDQNRLIVALADKKNRSST